ncbi:MAG: sigma-54-dependent Fis family transcriptional regulator [Verrucomicrobia bacterium]|nr:sigma-54-dependent Fis family transcriptional regulator [Verrucomicrobiota bacterium]
MPKAKVLVIDDEKLVRWSLDQKLQRDGYEVECAATGEEGLDLLRQDGHDVVLLDMRLPGMDGVQVLQEIKKLGRDIAVIVITADTGVARAVECMRLGAHNYLCKPFEFEEVRVELEKAIEDIKLRREVTRLRGQQHRKFDVNNLVGDSPAMRTVRDLITKIAQSNATTVFIEGENGTGKELAARAIHFDSGRADQPLMDINCSAVAENLFESELFGHERGAFTDAKTAKKGLLELADGGTLLLDEIGDMKLSMQAKLLRVMETRQFRRVGGTKDISVDVRMISMTNKNLEDAVARNEFRQDLYYRLKVISVRMPALREHPADAVRLAQHFLQRFAQEFKRQPKQLAPETQEALLHYAWPGNVRELRNTIERIVLLEADETVLPDHLPAEIRSGARRGGRPVAELPPEGVKLEDVERDLVRQAVERAGGNQTQAAELLGIERDALRRRLQKFNLIS